MPCLVSDAKVSAATVAAITEDTPLVTVLAPAEKKVAEDVDSLLESKDEEEDRDPPVDEDRVFCAYLRCKNTVTLRDWFGLSKTVRTSYRLSATLRNRLETAWSEGVC